MKRLKVLSILMVLTLALSLVGTTFASVGVGLLQEDTGDEGDTGEDVDEEECAPVEDDEATAEPTDEATAEPTEEPTAEPTEEPEDPCDDDFTNPVVALLGEYFGGEGGDLTEEIETYHEEGIGLGVLVKLYAISAATGIPVDQLVDEFKGGKGMGQLFKEYGKPDLLGVGHVKQAMGLAGQGKTEAPGQTKEDKDKGKGKSDDGADTSGDDAKDKGKPDDKGGGKPDDGDTGGDDGNGGGGGSGGDKGKGGGDD